MILSYFKTKTVGLANLGNTCFINTCLQIISYTFEINEVVIQRNPTGNKEDNLIFLQWRELLIELWKRRKEEVIIHPNKFIFYIHKVAKSLNCEVLSDWSQNDFSEFLHFFITRLHCAIKSPIDVQIQGTIVNEVDKMAHECYSMLKREYAKEYSPIMDICYGTMISELWSHNKKTRHSMKAELFMTIDLPIAPTLLASFEKYTTEEWLEGDAAWFNEKTGRKEAVWKQLRFWNLPPILVLTLKRFGNDNQKKGEKMTYPIEGLCLTPFVCGYNKGKESIYDLYGVACHEGNTQGGHYYAYVMNNITKKWFYCNDDVVRPIENRGDIVTPKAYCLFYRLRKNYLK